MFRIFGIVCGLLVATAAANKYLPEELRQSLSGAFDAGVAQVAQYLPDEVGASGINQQPAPKPRPAVVDQTSTAVDQTVTGLVDQGGRANLGQPDNTPSPLGSDLTQALDQPLNPAPVLAANDDPSAVEPLKHYKVLPPFKSKQSAQGFASHLTRITEHAFYVESAKRGYQVQFEYQDEAELVLVKQLLKSKAGVNLL